MDAQSVLDLLPDGVVLAGPDARVTQVNAAALRLLEYDGPDPVGCPLGEVIVLQNLDGADWYNCALPYTGIAVRRRLVETSWRTAHGTEVLVTATLHRSSPAGSVDQVAVALRDGRSREQVDLARSDLVATVAHELRSPLTGVKGFTATLLSKWDRFTESQKLLMLRTVDADADRLSRLITELLDVARIDSGRLSVRKQPLDVVAAVRRQLEPLSVPGERQIRLAGHDRVEVWADLDKLAQIVANLVENGIKHGDGDVHVTVLAREPLDGELPGGAEILVDDSGEGIHTDIRPRIFTKFWKHGSPGGSGLGLYIVGGLVSAHAGQVLVESLPAGGARMRVLLPYGEPAAVG